MFGPGPRALLFWEPPPDPFTAEELLRCVPFERDVLEPAAEERDTAELLGESGPRRFVGTVCGCGCCGCCWPCGVCGAFSICGSLRPRPCPRTCIGTLPTAVEAWLDSWACSFGAGGF